jgi:formate hydrogenlyase subunit 3/multisubunit Na+/H+ antiporter MnhD subunit
MNTLLALIWIPLSAGILCLAIPNRIRGLIEGLSVTAVTGFLGLSIAAYSSEGAHWTWQSIQWLKLDMLNRFILLATALFGFLIVLYSLQFMAGHRSRKLYYSAILFSLAGAAGVLAANHMLLFLACWGFLGITLYWLVITGGGGSSKAAQKTLIIIGGSDALILLGILMLYHLQKTFLLDQIHVPVGSLSTFIIFICLAIGAFAKAGAMPVHTWIPDVAEAAPIPVTAFLPAALDKLLGIYLLARLCLSIMEMTFFTHMILMIVGSVTIIAAVMMALTQHDYRKLLAYHAVSQVGYMVLGIGTGHPLGIAGGLFHMLNHSIYKSCLFLCSGSIQYRTQETNLDKLGGLARKMPVTFIGFIIAAFAISGIPPFNGFVSKWMIYQGVLINNQNDPLWLVWIVAAMFGSGLTLASFMKLTHSIFLGVPSARLKTAHIKETGLPMLIPTSILALLCVLFGVFAYSLPLKYFISPVFSNLTFTGLWAPGYATMIILLGLIIGIIIYAYGKIGHSRTIRSFVGGEQLESGNRISGTGFYNTIRQLPGLRPFYVWAEAKYFDVYEILTIWSNRCAQLFRKIHTGVLTLYLVWIVAGLSIILLLFMSKL